jgi:hypothetical protein
VNDELRVSRRGLLEMVSAIVVTASFAARRPLFRSDVALEEPLDAEVIEDEPSISDRARGVKFERFLRSRGIRPAHLARESGYSRQHLLGIRLCRIEPTRTCIADIVAACRRLTREPVHASDLFDLPRGDVWTIERIQRRLSDQHE